MEWIIIVAIAIAALALVSANASGPQRQLQALQRWFDEFADANYDKVQEKLRSDFLTPFDKEEHWTYSNADEYRERRNRDRLEYRENELWRRHALTVLASDQYSTEAKRSAVNAWYDYISAQQTLMDFIHIGVDTASLERSGKGVYDTRNSLVGVMAAFGFDLEQESNQLAANIAGEFPPAHRKARRAV